MTQHNMVLSDSPLYENRFAMIQRSIGHVVTEKSDFEKCPGGRPSFRLVPGSRPCQKRTRTLTGTPIFIFSLSPVNYTSETPQNSFLKTMKSFRVKSSENKSKTCENHVFSRVFTCTSHFFDQKFKYREPNQARTSRKTTKITFFHVFFSFCGYLL